MTVLPDCTVPKRSPGPVIARGRGPGALRSRYVGPVIARCRTDPGSDRCADPAPADPASDAASSDVTSDVASKDVALVEDRTSDSPVELSNDLRSDSTR